VGSEKLGTGGHPFFVSIETGNSSESPNINTWYKRSESWKVWDLFILGVPVHGGRVFAYPTWWWLAPIILSTN
jgi:hypothetical protein